MDNEVSIVIVLLLVIAVFAGFGGFIGVTSCNTSVPLNLFTQAKKSCESNGGAGFLSVDEDSYILKCKNGAEFDGLFRDIEE